MIDPNYYNALQEDVWFGRIDGFDTNQLRWHQSIKSLNLNKISTSEGNKNVAFLGFVSDEGVKRNNGRIGAAKSPERIRKLCSSLPDIKGITLYDAGDILCYEGNLERAQQQLALGVEKLLKHGFTPVLLGGGHEIVFGHYSGIKQAFQQDKIGIISFDAHFDLRKPDNSGVNSGTGFWQIAESTDRKPLDYLAIGIQRASNTQELFEEADSLQVAYILETEVNPSKMEYITQQVNTFCEKVDKIYLTIDMDVFSSAYAPGVSASNPKGLTPDYVFDEILAKILKSGKVVSTDFAEVNPNYDLDNRTSKLTARLIFDLLNLL